MPGCCVPLCTNHNKKGVRMFRFPASPGRRQLWLAQVKRDGWEPTSASRICSVFKSVFCYNIERLVMLHLCVRSPLHSSPPSRSHVEAAHGRNPEAEFLASQTFEAVSGAFLTAPGVASSDDRSENGTAPTVPRPHSQAMVLRNLLGSSTYASRANVKFAVKTAGPVVGTAE
ncbi:hypothetical protein HPB51_028589 [Rhipicephalus microplus]|uniref:THAP-type domain-containing protein n=1 Tax=Rhipicephalus microplus TaxID=6941 RepID=A0A9J6CXE7_RHIMP|nr:hypothetical protein HPB51_028589 [Rhipicephalus microplus]